MKDRVILAFSGGLDTSIAVKWLQEQYDYDVLTLTVDVGQAEDFHDIERKAVLCGSSKHYSIDAKEEFVEKCVFPAIKANALYEDKYPLSTALSRPLIAEKLVDIAVKEDASAVAHGCSGKGNDQVRFEVTVKAKAPRLKIIAPIREWNLNRTEEIEYAKKHEIPIPVNLNKPYSVDQSLWGRSIECGILEDPYKEPPDDIYEWTKSPVNAPASPETIKISFKKGLPVSINDETVDPVTLIQKVNTIAGNHGIGRIDHIEDRLVGLKSREIYECPGAVTLIEAHKDLEKTVITRHEASFKELVDKEWSYLAYTGLWVDPLRSDLEAFINMIQRRVTGDVKLKMYKGTCTIIGRRSPNSLYNKGLIAYDAESPFKQQWSEGFIEIWGLPSRIATQTSDDFNNQEKN